MASLCSRSTRLDNKLILESELALTQGASRRRPSTAELELNLTFAGLPVRIDCEVVNTECVPL